MNWSFKYLEFRVRLRNALRRILTRLLMVLPILEFGSINLYLHDLDDVEMFEKWLERSFPGLDREEFLRAERPSRCLRIFDALYVTKDHVRLDVLLQMVLPYTVVKGIVLEGVAKRKGEIRWLMDIRDRAEICEDLLTNVRKQLRDDREGAVANLVWLVVDLGLRPDINRFVDAAGKLGYSEALVRKLRELPGYQRP